MTYVKSIDNDVTHRKIFTLSKLLVTFYTLKYGEFITYHHKSFGKFFRQYFISGFNISVITSTEINKFVKIC